MARAKTRTPISQFHLVLRFSGRKAMNRGGSASLFLGKTQPWRPDGTEHEGMVAEDSPPCLTHGGRSQGCRGGEFLVVSAHQL